MLWEERRKIYGKVKETVHSVINNGGKRCNDLEEIEQVSRTSKDQKWKYRDKS